ncbi:hypothetical protein STXM2123_5533 [Streptomyces sp. F-3]|jgi:hypothetical protein|uniref:DUF2511 domain-containing protein n=1 Tax=Streptomyces thermogriseus TaxID=75292 RepID=A0ABN1T598_9ACTN|nr:MULTISPECIES: DUF2511 domain-containing protein [Streptomyces]GAT84832.1 hypothetical protein STXM2123_5533 [Streptomyces sp. F-3]
MRIRATAAAAAVSSVLALTACSGSATADGGSADGGSSVGTAAKTTEPAGHISERTIKPWPFTVASGTLACSGQAVTFTIPEGTYGLNDAAQARHPAPDPIWAEDPDNPGSKIPLTEVIDEGLKLCK